MGFLSNLKLVLSLVGLPVVMWSFPWVILTTIITTVIFVLVGSGLGQLPAAFFASLVTLDSLLIGVTALIASIIVISLDVQKIQQSFEEVAIEEEPKKWVKELMSLVVATGPLFLVMLAVTPYFVSAAIAIVGLVMPEGLSVYFAAVGFWITLATFLSIMAILWKILTSFWGAQKENIGKLLVYALKKYNESRASRGT